MQGKPLFWRIYSYFLIIMLGALLTTAWYVTHAVYQFYQQQVVSDLQVRAQIFAREAAVLPGGDQVGLDRLCKELWHVTLTRFTVIRPDGCVLADSAENPASMENHRTRPEIVTALAGGIGQSIRYSDTLRHRLIYLAIPIRQDGAIVRVVRTSLPLTVMDEALRTFYHHVAIGGAAVASVFLVLALLLSRRMSRPLYYMRQAAERFSQGELTARVPVPDTAELGALACTMNQMAGQLSERIRSTARQNHEQRAVLANMVEGVLAVDVAEHVLHINPAAASLLGVTPDAGRGRHILEVVRNIDLQEFLLATLNSDVPTEREVVLRGGDERILQVHGAALKDADGVHIGALVVMNDITRLKRLEGMRRDFVANVSHELKTPITTLKGCVETLLDGMPQDPAETARFLDMMGRHVNRLEAMVEDLLSLSRLEHEAERGDIPLEAASLGDVLVRAVQTFSGRAEEKGLLLVLDCPAGIRAKVNAALLEQAVGNLLDNAIKYSPEKTRISVTLARRDDQIDIRVTDQGPGIERKHLDRIFERFYRVDQARSRAMGGTGLGLAIVKHVVLAHHGAVTVESVFGQGSTFILTIPQG